jgi:hypothetical protein
MPTTKRIIIEYTCDHAGPQLEPVIEKYWNTTSDNIGRVCYCLPNGEKEGCFKPTPMKYKISIEEKKGE